jgi:hypothetical protein
MARPTKNSVMKRHVLSTKYKDVLSVMDYAVFMLKGNIMKVIVSTFCVYLVRILLIYEAINKFQTEYKDLYKQAFDDNHMTKNFN